MAEIIDLGTVRTLALLDELHHSLALEPATWIDNELMELAGVLALDRYLGEERIMQLPRDELAALIAAAVLIYRAKRASSPELSRNCSRS